MVIIDKYFKYGKSLSIEYWLGEFFVS